MIITIIYVVPPELNRYVYIDPTSGYCHVNE